MLAERGAQTIAQPIGLNGVVDGSPRPLAGWHDGLFHSCQLQTTSATDFDAKTFHGPDLDWQPTGTIDRPSQC
jgi:hypothetical protein